MGSSEDHERDIRISNSWHNWEIMSSPLIYSFAHRGLVMQGSAAAAKSSLTSKSAAGALVFSSLACNTIPSHAEAASDVDANSVLQACEATLTDRASAWDVFLRPIFSAFHPSEFAKTFIYKWVLNL